METHEQIARIRQLATDVDNYRVERDWNDSKLVREIPHLGSTKTFKRLLDAKDNLDELNIENRLKSLENAMEVITARRSKDRPAEKEYADFQNVLSVRQAVSAALTEESIARFVCVEGENGTGKDTSIRYLLGAFPKATVLIEAHGLWRDSLNVPLGEIIRALGVRRHADEGGDSFALPTMPSQRLELVLEELGKRKITLFINEAHEIGPRGLNLIRTIISQTPTVVVFFCIPALLARLIKVGYEEAAQLFGNRLCQRVRLSNPQVEEVPLLLERRGVSFVDVPTATAAAQGIANAAPSFGNWRFVTNVTRRAFATGKGKPFDTSAFVECITYAKSRAWTQQLTSKK